MDQINASGADPASRLPIARQMHAELSMAAANGLTRQNPQGVLDALNNPESAQGIAKSVLSDLNDAQREALRAKASGGYLLERGEWHRRCLPRARAHRRRAGLEGGRCERPAG